MSVDEDRKLFVAGLSDGATEQSLRGLFSEAGFEVADVSLPRDRATGKARGFSFVSLATSEQAKQARQRLDGSVFEGRSISVREFRSERSSGPRSPEVRERPHDGRGDGPGPGFGGARPAPYGDRGPTSGVRGAPRGGNDDNTVYVGNLPFDATQEDITALFNEAGFESVKRVHLPTDPEGRKRGFGFVTLEDEDAAKRAAETLNGQAFRGRSLGVNLARRGGAPGGGGGPSAAPRPRPAPRSYGPPSDFPRESIPPSFPDQPPAKDDEAWRAKKEKKKDKKRPTGKVAPERAPPQKQRRRNEEFRSSRARDYIDDWEDD